MLGVTPQGPGFLIFFQVPEVDIIGGGVEEITNKRKRKRKSEEDTIMLVIKSFLENNG